MGSLPEEDSESDAAATTRDVDVFFNLFIRLGIELAVVDESISGGGKVLVIVTIDCGNGTLLSDATILLFVLLWEEDVIPNRLTRTLLSLLLLLSGVVSGVGVSVDNTVVSAVASPADSDNFSLLSK